MTFSSAVAVLKYTKPEGRGEIPTLAAAHSFMEIGREC